MPEDKKVIPYILHEFLERPIGEVFECDEMTLVVKPSMRHNSCFGCVWGGKPCRQFHLIRGECTGRGKDFDEDCIFQKQTEG